MKYKLLLFFSLLISLNVFAQVSTFEVGPLMNGQTIVKNTSVADWFYWQVEYGPSGFTPGTGTLISDIYTDTTKVLLNPFLSYDFRIRNATTIGYTYFWTEMFTLLNCTDVNENVSPYTFNFDDSPILNCWRGYSYPANFYSNNVQYQDDVYRGSTGSSLLINSSNSGIPVYVISPKFGNLSNDKEIIFWLRGYTGSSLKVGTLSNPYDSTTFNELETVPVQSDAYTWFKIKVKLDNYNGTDKYIVFKFEYNFNNTSTIYIDDFTCQSACNPVTDFEVTEIGESNVKLNFNSFGQTAWEASVYSPNSFGSNVYEVNSSPYVIEGLKGNTDYQIKIRAVCNPEVSTDNYSDWSDTLNFKTICNPVTAGYSTSFEDNDNKIGPCWSYNAPLNAAVVVYSSINVNDIDLLLPKSGTKLLNLNTVFTSQSPTYLITPYIQDLDTHKRLRLWLVSKGNAYPNTSSLIIGTVLSPDDMSTFQPIQTITPEEFNEIEYIEAGDYWKQHFVNFTNFTNPDHHYIAFKLETQTFGSSIYMDDISYEEIPSCPEPFYPVMNSRTWNQAVVSWQDSNINSIVNEWQIEYGPSGFTPGTGTILNVTNNPATLSDLQEDTKYHFYVRSKCGTAYGNWSDNGSFTTRCIGVNTGYTYGFEDDLENKLNACWDRITPIMDPTSYWDKNILISTTDTNTSSYNVAHSGTKAVKLFNQFLNSDSNAFEKTILITPRLIGLNQFKTLSFWMNAKSSNDDNPSEIIIGTLSNPADYTTFIPFYTITNAAEFEDEWKKQSINFSTYNGTDEYVGIKQGANNDMRTFYFDDFEYLGAECTIPTSLTAIQSGENAITLGWDNNNTITPPTAWQIEYGIKNFETGTGSILNVTTNPVILTDIFENNIVYEYHVKNICQGSEGEWSVKYPLKISCAVTAPFYENFDQYNGAPEDNFCWTQNDNTISKVSNYCINEINSCPNALELGSLPEYGNGMIISPYLQDFDNTKKIKFYANNKYEDNIDLIVGTISNPADLLTFIPYKTLHIGGSTWGKEYEVDFSEYTGQSKNIAFSHGGVNYGFIFIDNVIYINKTDCNEPLNFWAYNLTDESALLKWENNNDNENFEIEYGEYGFTQGTGINVTTNNSEKLIDGLSTSTQYQAYLRSLCTETTSVWVGPVTFTTTCSDTNLPWLEDINNLPEYGLNKLPECFKIQYGEGIKSSDIIIPNNLDMDLSGYSDTSFIYLNGGFETSIITPTFKLNSGTTYNFSFMGRKLYEFSTLVIDVSTGRGNTFQAMETHLNTEDQLHQYQYNQLNYPYTPTLSGEYSFNFKFKGDGGVNVLIDRFELKEAYLQEINNSEVEFDFENGTSDDLILENTQNTTIGIIDEVDNSSIEMQGGINNTNWQNADIVTDGSGDRTITTLNEPIINDVWNLNSDFITKVNMKIDASAMQSLKLAFDLKQTFNVENIDSRFRVIINGNQISSEIFPETSSQDPYQNHLYDLTPYVGSNIYISLQHIGKSAIGIGDNAYLDNIKLNAEVLDTNNFEFSEFKIFPNPVKNIVTLQNSTSISDIEVYNISGQQLLKEKHNELIVHINFANFSTGVYFVKVNCGDKQKIVKIIKD